MSRSISLIVDAVLAIVVSLAVWVCLGVNAKAGDFHAVQQTVIQPVVVPYIWHVNPQSEVFSNFREWQAKQQKSQGVTVKSPAVDPGNHAAILKAKCAGCHSEGGKAEADLVLFDKSGELLRSLPYQTINSRITSEDSPMPPAGLLPERDRKTLEAWLSPRIKKESK